MNKEAKLREAMKNHSLGWQIDDLQVVARQHGITWRHDGGSHCVFIRPIKPIYIKKFLRLVAGE